MRPRGEALLRCPPALSHQKTNRHRSRRPRVEARATVRRTVKSRKRRQMR